MADGDNINFDRFDALFTVNRDQSETLNSIDRRLANMAKDMSQSELQNARRSRNDSDYRDAGRSKDDPKKRVKSATDEFLDGFEKSLKEALGVSDFKDTIKQSMSQFAEEMGTDLEHLPKELGKSLGNRLKLDFDRALQNDSTTAKQMQKWTNLVKDQQSKWMQSSIETTQAYLRGESIEPFDWVGDAAKDFGEAFKALVPDEWVDKANKIKESPVGQVFSDAASERSEQFGRAKSKVGDIADAAKGKISDKLDGTVLGKIGDTVGGKVGSIVGKVAKGPMAQAMSVGLKGVLAGAGPAGLIGGLVLDKLTESLGQIVDAFGKLLSGLGKAADRDQTSRQKKIELAQKRIEADTTAIIKAPFSILEEAAQKVYDAWDGALGIINQTQGYSKADLQDLVSSFAQRLRDEGLSDVISSSDITTNLKQVLESGLSGEVAEEFAYLATKLNAAIPTQDFFSYGSTYASLAANAIKDGKSQSEAIQYANDQLELFASNVLYANRQISGGFSTGLKDASSIFEQAVQIATASKVGNPSEIAGVLTSVSAITGAIAPDLASGIVEAVYNAAVGGNSSEIVALRSLAGINASNTEFLQQFVNDPQGVFTTLFRNLSDMQNMSESNYMEVAEGLSSIFGLDKSAFARVDFGYLADAVSAMNVSETALNENIQQLASGQSTLTAEQMRIRQINEYMIDEGLSYVLDNEVARSIQQHMWDEQLAQQMQENTYRVDLTGDSMTFLNDLLNVVRNIFGFLNPVTNILKAINVAQTAFEAAQIPKEIAEILETGKVGKGNAAVLRNLITTGQELNLTNTYLSQLQESVSKSSSGGYQWSVVGKSFAKALGTAAQGVAVSSPITTATNENIDLARMQRQFDKMRSTMSQYFSTTVMDTLESMRDAEAESLINKINLTSAANRKQIQSLIDNYKVGINEQGTVDPTLVGMTEEMARIRAEEQVRTKLEAQAREQAAQHMAEAIHQATTGEGSLKKNDKMVLEAQKAGYQAWADSAAKFGIKDFDSTIAELGYTASDLQNYFASKENYETNQDALDKEANQEKLQQEIREYVELINTNIHDVLDKSDLMGVMWPGIREWLMDIDSSGSAYGSGTHGTGMRQDINRRLDNIYNALNSFHEHWYNEYFKWYLVDNGKYSAQFGGGSYNWVRSSGSYASLNGDGSGYGASAYSTWRLETSANQSAGYRNLINTIAAAEKESTGDAITALADALMSSPIEDLLDPTVQTNVFLAKILNGVLTIIQQNNTQGKLKLPDAIAALATGYTEADTTNAKTGS